MNATSDSDPHGADERVRTVPIGHGREYLRLKSAEVCGQIRAAPRIAPMRSISA